MADVTVPGGNYYDLELPEDLPVLKVGEVHTASWRVGEAVKPQMFPPQQFLEKHGDSFVRWSCVDNGSWEPVEAFRVLLPDGGRGVVRRTLSDIGPYGWRARVWRRPVRGEKAWWPGELKITDKGVTFVDRDELLPHPILCLASPPGMDHFSGEGLNSRELIGWPELYVDLSSNAEFCEAVRDDDFARTAIYFLRDREIFTEADLKEVYFESDRRCADIAGFLRRCGESYIDLYVRLDIGRDNKELHVEIERMFADSGYIV